MTSDRLLAIDDPDTLALDDIVESKICDAVASVHSVAPIYLLDEGRNFGDAVYWGDLESGWVLLPQDFMRLIVFQMSDWDRGVFTAITPADPMYAYQRQRVKALRGTPQRPICAITMRPEGKCLEFYSCKSENAYVSRGQYLPYPKIDNHEGIDICERCYEAAVYVAASAVLLTIGEHEKSVALSEYSKTLLI